MGRRLIETDPPGGPEDADGQEPQGVGEFLGKVHRKISHGSSAGRFLPTLDGIEPGIGVLHGGFEQFDRGPGIGGRKDHGYPPIPGEPRVRTTRRNPRTAAPIAPA